MRSSDFPKPKDKIRARKDFIEYIYPYWVNMVDDAKTSIISGNEYTINRIEIYSSWCAVWLEELPPTKERPDRFFTLSFFEE